MQMPRVYYVHQMDMGGDIDVIFWIDAEEILKEPSWGVIPTLN